VDCSFVACPICLSITDHFRMLNSSVSSRELSNFVLKRYEVNALLLLCFISVLIFWLDVFVSSVLAAANGINLGRH